MLSLLNMEWFKQYLNVFCIGMAYCFLAAGVGAFVAAWRRLDEQKRQLKSLENFKRRLHDGVNRQDVRRDILINVCSEKRRQQWEKRTSEDVNDYAGEIAKALLDRDAKVPLSSMIGRRLLVICSMAQRNSSTSAMPALEELEQLTREHELTRISVWMLRSITNIILMCGICGTLWGVSEQLGNMSEQLGNNKIELDAIVKSLGPSMVAVPSFILLCILQGIFHGMLEVQIKRLDDLTLSIFVPLFLPESPWVRYEKVCRSAVRCLKVGELKANSKAIHLFLKETLLPVMRDWQKCLGECATALWACGNLIQRRVRMLLHRKRIQASRRRVLAGVLALVLKFARDCEEQYEQMHRHMAVMHDELRRLAAPLQAHCRALGDVRQLKRANRATKSVALLAQYNSPEAALSSLIHKIGEFREQMKHSLADLVVLHSRANEVGIALETYVHVLAQCTRLDMELMRHGQQLLEQELKLMPDVEHKVSMGQEWGSMIADYIVQVADYHQQRLQIKFSELRDSWRRGIYACISSLHIFLKRYEITVPNRFLMALLSFAAGIGIGALLSVQHSRPVQEDWRIPMPAKHRSNANEEPHHQK